MARLTAKQLIQGGKVGSQVFNPLFQQLGVTDWATDGGVSEGGASVASEIPNDAAFGRLKGYTFDWQDTGAGNTGTLTAYDPQGRQVGAYSQKDSSGWDDFKDFATLAAAGFGGAGLLGLGPLAGALGGAAGGSGTITGGGGLTAGGSAGYGSIGGTLGGAGGTTLGVAGSGMSAGAGLNSALLQGLGTASAGGGLLSAIPGATEAAAWMKQNPTLGRLITGGATSLLASAGGGSSGSAPAPVDPVKWNSPIQQGLLSPVQQYAPEPVKQNKPAGLLAQGYANDGAWRFLGG